MKRNVKGFSLVELLIVILTISIIAAIAIPNILSARRAANEGSCISSLRTLHSAQMTYITSKGGGNYAGTDSSIGDTVGLNELSGYRLIDEVLGSGMKSGYNFKGAIALSSPISPATFFFSANPVSSIGVTQSGTQRYNINESGVIRGDRANLAVVFLSTNTSSANPLNN